MTREELVKAIYSQWCQHRGAHGISRSPSNAWAALAADVAIKAMGAPVGDLVEREAVYVVLTNDRNTPDQVFVEIETSDGLGVRIDGHAHPNQPNLWRIGPLYRALPAPATVPLRGEKEIAGAIMGDWYADTDESSSLATRAAKVVLSHGLAFDVEKAAEQVAIEAQRTQIGQAFVVSERHREVARAILKAGVE